MGAANVKNKTPHATQNGGGSVQANTCPHAIRARVTLEPGLVALEYGCGTGLLSFALSPYLARITLADTSPGE